MPAQRQIAQDLFWVGGNDRRLALFESRFPIPRGISYNSYLLMDEKTALLDTVDEAVSQCFFANMEALLQGRPLDYLVLHHMEPDHAAMIGQVLRRWPKLTLVGNAKTFGLLEQFFPGSSSSRLTVQEGDSLCLGRHSLSFAMAPMVHWPETMVSFDALTGALFSGDAFGTFGAMAGCQFNDEVDFARDWLDDARRYYTNIVGKYGSQVQALLQKAAALPISLLCPLHGPVWRSNLSYFLEKYEKWSSYTPEDKAVAVFYASMYGHTSEAAELLAQRLVAGGARVTVYDVAHTHASYLIGESFRCSHLLLAAPTYNNGLFPAMSELLHDMAALNLQKRTIALVENGSWAPQAGKRMEQALCEMKEIRLLPERLSIRSALKAEQQQEVELLSQSILASLREG